jgi:hypothetical protein
VSDLGGFVRRRRTTNGARPSVTKRDLAVGTKIVDPAAWMKIVDPAAWMKTADLAEWMKIADLAEWTKTAGPAARMTTADLAARMTTADLAVMTADPVKKKAIGAALLRQGRADVTTSVTTAEMTGAQAAMTVAGMTVEAAARKDAGVEREGVGKTGAVAAEGVERTGGPDLLAAAVRPVTILAVPLAATIVSVVRLPTTRAAAGVAAVHPATTRMCGATLRPRVTAGRLSRGAKRRCQSKSMCGRIIRHLGSGASFSFLYIFLYQTLFCSRLMFGFFLATYWRMIAANKVN